MEENDIESFVIEQCHMNNVDLNISDENRVIIDGVVCNGFFSYKNGKNITIGKSLFDYNSLLLHEFCHAMQYIEQDPVYLDIIKLDKDVDEIIDDWLSFKIEIEKNILKKYIDLLLSVELDCEKRVVKLIKDNNFNLDLDLYIKKGNSYLLFYKKMLKERRWYDIPPYEIEKIWKTMPNKFEDIQLTKRLSNLYDRCFF